MKPEINESQKLSDLPMEDEKLPERFRFKHMWSLLKNTAIYWNRDDPWRLSAIIAYYAILSLPGLLVVELNPPRRIAPPKLPDSSHI